MESLNAFSASACACFNPARSETSLCATRIPRPPPPAAALMMTGYPISAASLIAIFSSSTAPSLPGTVGTFAFFASFLHATLSPTASIADTGGPMNSILQLRHTSAK